MAGNSKLKEEIDLVDRVTNNITFKVLKILKESTTRDSYMYSSEIGSEIGSNISNKEAADIFHYCVKQGWAEYDYKYGNFFPGNPACRITDQGRFFYYNLENSIQELKEARNKLIKLLVPLNERPNKSY